MPPAAARSNAKTVRGLNREALLRPLALQEVPPEPDTGTGLVAAVEGLERRMIREALAQANGVQTRAAELLGTSERVLRYKIKKYGLGGAE